MRIFAFGDSFTNGFEDEKALHVKEYISWKGYKPKGYLNFLSEYYSCEVYNFAIQGNDNYSILESFCNNFDKIKDDDLVVINWSKVERFRVVNTLDSWVRIVPNHLGILNQTDISLKTANEIMVNRMSKKYVEEVLNWSKLIDQISKGKKILQWSYIKDFKSKTINFINPIFENITRETNGYLNDNHFSEKGNEELSKYILKYLTNNLI
jgi:hypothetical protein